jgi:hypothetical protein
MQPSHIIKKLQPYDFHHYSFICIVPSLSQGCNPPVCHVSKPCSVPFPLHFLSVHLFFTMSVQFNFPIALRLPFFYQPIIKKQHRKRCIGSFLCSLPVPCLPVPSDRRSMLCGWRPTIATAGGSFRSVTGRGTNVLELHLAAPSSSTSHSLNLSHEHTLSHNPRKSNKALPWLSSLAHTKATFSSLSN